MILCRAYFRFVDALMPILDIRDCELDWEGTATLLAPSGTGKTTLFRLLSGWFGTTDRNEAVCELSPPMDRVRDVRFVGTDAGLLPWLTVGGNVRLRAGRRDALDSLLADMGLEAKVLEQFPYQLSLGMYKRVELLIACLASPRLLLLDEVFASIDSVSKGQVISFMNRHRLAHQTWLITHELETAEAVAGPRYGFRIDDASGTVRGVCTI